MQSRPKTSKRLQGPTAAVVLHQLPTVRDVAGITLVMLGVAMQWWTGWWR